MWRSWWERCKWLWSDLVSAVGAVGSVGFFNEVFAIGGPSFCGKEAKLMSIYQEIILDHARHPHNKGALAGATNAVGIKNASCGDSLTMTVRVDDGVLIDVAFDGQGCVISQASASLLTDYAKGKRLVDLKKMEKSAILNLLGIELSPNRLKCALLALEGLQKAVN